jgi:hypothetical protein
VDEELTSYLKTQQLEFQVFDDLVPIVPVSNNQMDDNEDMPSDFIGRALVDLNNLSHDKLINQEFAVTNYKNKKVGSVHIKIYWKDFKEPLRNRIEDVEMTKNWEYQTKKKIVDCFMAKHINNLKTAFNVCDHDGDQEISF